MINIEKNLFEFKLSNLFNKTAGKVVCTSKIKICHMLRASVKC